MTLASNPAGRAASDKEAPPQSRVMTLASLLDLEPDIDFALHALPELSQPVHDPQDAKLPHIGDIEVALIHALPIPAVNSAGGGRLLRIRATPEETKLVNASGATYIHVEALAPSVPLRPDTRARVRKHSVRSLRILSALSGEDTRLLLDNSHAAGRGALKAIIRDATAGGSRIGVGHDGLFELVESFYVTREGLEGHSTFRGAQAGRAPALFELVDSLVSAAPKGSEDRTAASNIRALHRQQDLLHIDLAFTVRYHFLTRPILVVTRGQSTAAILRNGCLARLLHPAENDLHRRFLEQDLDDDAELAVLQGLEVDERILKFPDDGWLDVVGTIAVVEICAGVWSLHVAGLDEGNVAY